MQHLTLEHWILLVASVGAISLQGVSSWHDLLTPAFVASALAQVVIVLRAIYTTKPTSPWDGQDRRLPPSVPPKT